MMMNGAGAKLGFHRSLSPNWLMGLGWDDHLAATVDHADVALQSGRPAPFAVVELMSAIHAVRPDAEVLAWVADILIAAILNGPFPCLC